MLASITNTTPAPWEPVPLIISAQQHAGKGLDGLQPSVGATPTDSHSLAVLPFAPDA